MNKKFLKGVAALFAVAILGVSCSNNNPNTPQEKETFPGLTVSDGANGGKDFGKALKGKVVATATASTVQVTFEKNTALTDFQPKTVNVTKVEKATDADNAVDFTTVVPTDFTVDFDDTTADITLKGDKAKALYDSLSSGTDNVTLKLTITITSDKYKDGTVEVYVNYKKTEPLTITAPSTSGKNDTDKKIATVEHSFATSAALELIFQGGDSSKVQQKANARIISVAGIGKSGAVASVEDLSALTDLSAHFDLEDGSAATKIKLKALETLTDVLVGDGKPLGESPNEAKKGEVEVTIRFTDPDDTKAPVDVTFYVLLTGNN